MTPLYKINFPRSNVWAKLESQNPTGTHKDRSMKPWIEYYLARGIKEFAISSSGNSAISAAKFCAENSLRLHVFVSPDIDRAKMSALQGNPSVVLYVSKTPRKDSLQYCKKSASTNLRASTDDNALVGYQDIALELIQQLPSIDNIFIPVSSGATLEGMYLGYRRRGTNTPRLFAVQTTKVHPIASYFDRDFTSEKTSHARAIVDNVAHRRDRVIKIIEETGGGGFVISTKELEEAKKILGKVGWQSALAFAGFLKWSRFARSGEARQTQNTRKKADRVSVCIFTD